MSAPYVDPSEAPRYTPHDLAYHPVLRHQVEDGGVLADVLDWHAEARGGPMVAAELIMRTCAVGYGGHYGEVLEEHQEGGALAELARLLGPYYSLPHLEAYRMLEQVRDEWTHRMSAGADAAKEQWRREGYVVDVRPQSCDHCPTCAKKITDHDDEGCEAPDGQRWCIGHALEMLSRLRRSTLEARGELG